jgi:hypothetical protein
MTATKASAQGPQRKSTPHGTASAIDLSKLLPGEEYVVTWNDGDRQRYRVEEIRDGYVIRKRWIAHLERWTEWNGVQKISEVERFSIEMCQK